MASACVNTISATKYGWLSSRVSFSRDDRSTPPVAAVPEVDFEFRLEDPVSMLPADELFSDGKLVPLHLSSLRPSGGASASRASGPPADPFLYSPKAPRCSSRWRELLGLKKAHQGGETLKTASSSTKSSTLKSLLHRSSKSSLSQPLLKDSDCESVSVSSSTRLSLSSSSSSGHDHDDPPRLSLEAPNPFKAPNPNPPRMRLVKPTAANGSCRVAIRRAAAESGEAGSMGVSVDSPRMNPSGKIVFQSLERSSSSPSSFNGGPRFKHRGMERSYSANVRVTPVLNVPVCSLRGSSKSGSVFGFGQIFSSPQKRDSNSNSTGPSTSSTRAHHSHHHRNRTDRN